MSDTDSAKYRSKKAFFDRLLTIYGRKPVLEALRDKAVPFHKLHLAESNKPAGIIREILELAEARGIPVAWHSKAALSRISKNSKQDQGVAADLQLQHYQMLEDFLRNSTEHAFRLIALDGVTNPQNLGMIVRSVTAAGIDGLLLPAQGCAALSPLVIKASAGTLFKARIVRCGELAQALSELRHRGATICTLSSHAKSDLFSYRPQNATVFVLGNETDGVSSAVAAQADAALNIPMKNGVESLNVAVTAALVAFLAGGR